MRTRAQQYYDRLRGGPPTLKQCPDAYERHRWEAKRTGRFVTCEPCLATERERRREYSRQYRADGRVNRSRNAKQEKPNRTPRPPTGS